MIAAVGGRRSASAPTAAAATWSIWVTTPGCSCLSSSWDWCRVCRQPAAATRRRSPQGGGLLLLAEAIDGEEALRLRLANRVLAPADLLPFAREQGLKLAAKPPMALQKSKALLKQELKQAVHFVIDLEARLRPGPAREEAQNRIANKLQNGAELS